MQSYLDRLDEELSKQPGFKKPPIKTIKKRRTTSKTDPDSGCINHGKKSGIGYLMETTVDCKCGIITGVDVYPANEKESLLVLRHLERQIQNGVPMQNIALDRGYDTGAVHRGLELQDIFLLFSFPIPRKSTVLSIYLKKMRFVARKAPD